LYGEEDGCNMAGNAMATYSLRLSKSNYASSKSDSDDSLELDDLEDDYDDDDNLSKSSCAHDARLNTDESVPRVKFASTQQVIE
jgi:hypothetical protein